MPWSNSPDKGAIRKAKSVLSKELAEKTVLEFVPMRFDLGTPEQAMGYLEQKQRSEEHTSELQSH